MAIIHGDESRYMRIGVVAARLGTYALGVTLLIELVAIAYRAIVHPTASPVITFLGAMLSMGIVYALVSAATKPMFRDGWNSKIGLRSENTAFLELKQLPESYHVFRNVQFDHSYDVDFVVVGPRGVFVIEVNSTRGDVSAVGDVLVVEGVLMDGSTAHRKNRLKQALRNTLEVSEYLDGKYFVQGAAVFAHYRSKLRLGFRKVGGVFVIKHQWITKLILEESDDQHLTHEQQFWAIEKLQFATRS